MSVTATHTLYGIEAGTGVLIGGITRQNIATNSQINGEVTSGEVYRRFLSLYQQKITPGFSTLAIAAALGQVGVSGVSIADMTGGLDLFAQKNLCGGTRSSGSTHRRFTFSKGILVPRRLSVNHGGDATLDYEAVIAYDGVNAPVVITDSIALPTGLLGMTERFTMAGMTIGSVSVGAKQSWSIDFGIDAVGEGADSDIYDTCSYIRTIQSQLTVESIDVGLLAAANIPLTGKVATHATTSIYLRKRLSGGTGFVADGTPEHVKITCDGLIVPDNAFTADGGNSGRVSFTLPLRYDGTNAPVIINTASAIA